MTNDILIQRLKDRIDDCLKSNDENRQILIESIVKEIIEIIDSTIDEHDELRRNPPIVSFPKKIIKTGKVVWDK